MSIPTTSAAPVLHLSGVLLPHDHIRATRPVDFNPAPVERLLTDWGSNEQQKDCFLTQKYTVVRPEVDRMESNERSSLDDIDPFEDAPSSTDPNVVAVEEWKASTTTFERVEAILRRTRASQSAKEIADRASVSEPTARKHLTSLAESNRATTERSGNTTRYRRNEDQRRWTRIQTLADEHTREELAGAIREMKAEIRGFETEYDATSPDELAGLLEPDDEMGWENLTRWKTTRRNLAFATTALSFKETRTIDAMSSGDLIVENDA